jgi:hypothetical protein
MAKKRSKNYNPIMAARQALRRAFSRSPIILELMKENRRKVPRFKKDGSRHKVDAVEHLCDVCSCWKRSTKDSKIAIDHIKPVIDPEIGFVDLNTYFDRLWCHRSNLRKICQSCHTRKNNSERFVKKFKEEQKLLTRLELCHNKDEIKNSLKRFTKKKLSKFPYPDEFKRRIDAIRNGLKNK